LFVYSFIFQLINRAADKGTAKTIIFRNFFLTSVLLYVASELRAISEVLAEVKIEEHET
jgi:hypothetical protein